MKLKIVIATIVTFFCTTNTQAAIYHLQGGDSIVGQRVYRPAYSGETVAQIAKHYDLGHNAIVDANPEVNVHSTLSTGTTIQIPTQHLLPNSKREGIVINLPEMRLYYYPAGSHDVYTYPIGIGKVGKTIPIEAAKIVRKTKDPIWIPPDDIREYNLTQGIVLPKIMPAGPDNPLGPYAIYMSIPTYLIHSTPFTDSIGKRASFGCIRMYQWDIKEFFPTIKRGIPVVILNSPTKVGWHNDQLYLEVHRPLAEHSGAFEASLPGMVALLTRASLGGKALIDWQLVSYIAEHRDGIPHRVGIRLP